MNSLDDRQKNKMVNDAEFTAKRIELASTPQYVTIGAHNRCNANCKFCLGGDYPNFSLQIYKDFFELKLKDVLQNAAHIGFCGYGEVLLMPDILEFIDHLNITLPGVQKVFTTNGSPLKETVTDKLAEGDYSILLSMHASNKDLHKFIVGIDAYDLIVNNIKRLVKIKREKRPSLHINLIFVVSELNITDLPDFVRMADELGVDRITCNYMTMFDTEHVPWSCFFNQSRTNAIFDEAEEIARDMDLTLVLPPKFGDLSGENQLCRDPWEFFYVETQGSVLPCCNAGGHIGYLDKQDFSEIWNSEGYKRLRQGFKENKPYSWCKDCLKYNSSKINDIRSHITARPETLKEILDYIKKYPSKFGDIKVWNE